MIPLEKKSRKLVTLPSIIATYSIEVRDNKNKTYSARMVFGGCPFLGEGHTEREAIADLMLAMGLMTEMKALSGMAADHDLHG